MRQVILVNGVPASGKSTVLKRVTDDLIDRGIAAVPLTLDNVKEGLFEEIGIGDRDHNRMLGRASYRAIFNSIAAFPDALVPLVDAWHGFQPPEVLNAHLALARTDHVVEIWCDVTPATAAARYRARSAERHAGHLPPSYAEELFALAASAAPRALGPVIRIDGEAPLGTGDLDRIHRALTAP